MPPSGDGPYDRDEARALLEARGALSALCSRCGASDWHVGEKLSVVDALDPHTFEMAIGYDTTMVLVPVVCDRCGNARRHDWTVLTGRRVNWPDD